MGRSSSLRQDAAPGGLEVGAGQHSGGRVGMMSVFGMRVAIGFARIFRGYGRAGVNLKRVSEVWVSCRNLTCAGT